MGSTWWGSPNTNTELNANNLERSTSLGNESNEPIQSSNFSKKHRIEEDDQTLDLFQRTLDTLDYPYVLNALSSFCRTTPASDLIQQQMKSISKKEKDLWNDNDILNMPLTAQTVEGVHHRYGALKEM